MHHSLLHTLTNYNANLSNYILFYFSHPLDLNNTYPYDFCYRMFSLNTVTHKRYPTTSPTVCDTLRARREGGLASTAFCLLTVQCVACTHSFSSCVLCSARVFYDAFSKDIAFDDTSQPLSNSYNIIAACERRVAALVRCFLCSQ